MQLNTTRLREELLRMGLKQRDLAKKIGISDVSMSRYCNGWRKPREHILVKMACALMTTPEYLTGVDGMEHPDFAFAQTRMNIRTYADRWTRELKTELVNEILKTL